MSPESMPGRIVAATRALLREGNPAPSISSIARRAGVSRITVHRHFGSREALLNEVGVAPERSGTRDRIIHAAGEVIARVGYQSATIEEIVRVAGISTPTFYSHFARKEDVLIAIVEVVSDRIRAIGQHLRGNILRDRSDIVALLKRMMATQAAFFDLAPALLFAVAGRPDLAERVFEDVILPTWDALGEATRPPGTIEPIESTRARAMALIGMATYYSLTRQVFARRPEFPDNGQAIEQFARIFREGVGRGSDSG